MVKSSEPPMTCSWTFPCHPCCSYLFPGQPELPYPPGICRLRQWCFLVEKILIAYKLYILVGGAITIYRKIWRSMGRIIPLSGWWLTYPSEKWWSSVELGWWHSHILWKIKFHGSKPPTRWDSDSNVYWPRFHGGMTIPFYEWIDPNPGFQ